MQKHTLRATTLAAALALTLTACKSGEDAPRSAAGQVHGSSADSEALEVGSNAAPALLGEVRVAELGSAAPDFRLVDSAGVSHELSDFRGEPVVLEWVNLDCPFVKKHYGAGNMQALQERYTGEGVTWLTISSSGPGKQGHLDSAGWNAAIADQGIAATAVLLDETGIVGKAYDARTTPNMCVIDGEGRLVYRGAIDDQASPSPATLEGATNYVAVTLDALLQGNDVEPKETRSYGCGIKYAN
ncbi:redoxin domain-containing protein [Engelhardtia mirabilis]|uniref:Thiol-disulfide oxidoreductase n=1 Tax=Engelhardtia mirabilis TaxID=2528011 RepID=A0A518BH47_9BACT|nr:thiol-disulfide oxidoreductase [Planctomycetes bacterium Pla133]QDV00612.1 thiol-disulfide oxidoreductase [Planctomycetes bacterium Pla86]